MDVLEQASEQLHRKGVKNAEDFDRAHSLDPEPFTTGDRVVVQYHKKHGGRQSRGGIIRDVTSRSFHVLIARPPNRPPKEITVLPDGDSFRWGDTPVMIRYATGKEVQSINRLLEKEKQ